MHIACRLHVGEDILLQLRYGLQGVRHVLILLDVTNDFSRLCPLGKVDQICAFDQRGYAVFDKGQVCKIDALEMVSTCCKYFFWERASCTEEGYAGWVCPMQSVSVFCKVFGATHEFTHAFQRRH
jgi:hypothetical protein